MCFGLAPTKAGTPFSRLDKRNSVVDTGTRVDETRLPIEVVMIFVGVINRLERVRAVSRPYRRTCRRLTIATVYQYP